MKALRFLTFAFIVVCLLLPASSPSAQQAQPAAPGDLDPEFGEGGKLVVPLDVFSPGPVRLVVQPDGKLLVAVTVNVNASSGSLSHILVLRLLPDGSPDTSFSGDGSLEVSSPKAPLSFDMLPELILQPDGNILIVGGTVQEIFMARYLPDGSPDTSFGEGGMVHAGYAGGEVTGSAASLLPGGEIMVGGIVHVHEAIDELDEGIFVARFSSSGSLDESFGQNGFGLELLVVSGNEGIVSADDLVVLPDGRIVVVGEKGHDVGGWVTLVFDADGSLDTSIWFPTDETCAGCFNWASATVVQPDGGILVAGVRSRSTEEDGNTIWLANGFAMMRLHPDGSQDQNFGEGGDVFTNFPGSNDDVAYAMALQADGRIILAGQTHVTSDFALARYHPNGSLDESFGEDGRVTTDFGGSDGAYAVVIQPDGKIVAAGRSSFRDAEGNLQSNLVLARYLAEGAEGPIDVTIDIRPGIRRNIIVLGRTRLIPVAIFSTEEFDARQIDKSSLTFGRTGEEDSLLACFRDLDLNRDRLPDSLCFFLTRRTGFQVGDTVGILMGTMQDGTHIEGHDDVIIRRWRRN